MRAPDRFDDGRPMLLAGLRRTYGFQDGPTQIPAAWEEFAPTTPLPGQIGTDLYGATGGADMQAGTFDYMCAAEVSDFDGLADGVGRMKVPAAKYAVFVHRGPIQGIRDTIEAGYAWLASNGEWKDGETPCLEWYGPAFNPETGADTEFRAPVVPAA